MAAPTGKAAQRLSQALRDGKVRLQQSLASQAGDWAAALDAIPESAQTLHRLLGALPAEDRFRHNREQPLPWDIVVVDEASMVDLASMRALLDALADTATLVLVGDPDQLVSVSAGSVLADIVAASAQGGGFEQHTAQLTHVWRTGSELALAYAAARRGAADELRRCLQHIEACGIHAINDPRMLATRVQHWLALPQWSALHAACARVDDPAAAFVALRAQQLLTALRAGPFGAEVAQCRHRQPLAPRQRGAQWYPGRPVLIRNN
ncbi:MAG: AAA family ATPase, partial [Rhodanobacteraceae bacterium]|nr:AAA family ATPase [Rhodanobacteraceae bacterium]